MACGVRKEGLLSYRNLRPCQTPDNLFDLHESQLTSTSTTYHTLTLNIFSVPTMDSIITPISSGPSIQRPTKPARRAGTTRERLGCLTCRHRSVPPSFPLNRLQTPNIAQEEEMRRTISNMRPLQEVESGMQAGRTPTDSSRFPHETRGRKHSGCAETIVV